MKKLNFLKALILVPTSLLIVGCGVGQAPIASEAEEMSVGPTGFYSKDNVSADQFANDVLPAQEMLSLRKKIGTSFLVEQFNVKIFPTMIQAIKSHPPAGIVYWNPEGVDAKALAQVNATYSKEVELSGSAPLLLSTDYEGGGYNTTVKGKIVPGIQRFTKGFTKLVHPAWLGKSLAQFDMEMCSLHGRIMAQELKQAGINYPLATVSDLGKHLFANRGVSTQPEEISACLGAILQAFHQTQNMVLVTKHFPGLGDTVGDTHDGTVISKATTREQLEPSVKPFRSLINQANLMERPETLSILASHAMYKVLDANKITTVSSQILQNFLRRELKFSGVVVSDAMWMGEYGKLSTQQLLPIYLESVLAGMDVLMIAGKTFSPAVQFMRNIFDDKIDSATKASLELKFSMPFSEIRKLYILRLKESSARLAQTQKMLKPAFREYDLNNYLYPESLTSKLSQRYFSILNAIKL